MDMIPQDDTPRKQCTGPCGRTLPATTEFFYGAKDRKNGLEARCKECRNKKQKAYYEQPEIHEHMLERKRAYKKRPEVQERIQSYGKSYNQRLEVQARHKAYCQVYNKTYYKIYYNSPNGRERYRTKSNKRLAREKAVPGNYTVAQIQERLKRQRYRCYYCSNKFEKRKERYIYHIEHTFPLSREGASNDISYIVLACPACNLSKGDKYPWEWHQGGRLL